jgi:hypothetical protein
MCSAGFPEMATVEFGIIVTSADAADLAVQRFLHAIELIRGGHDLEDVARLRTSSAPPSSATSMTRFVGPGALDRDEPALWNISRDGARGGEVAAVLRDDAAIRDGPVPVVGHT